MCQSVSYDKICPKCNTQHRDKNGKLMVEIQQYKCAWVENQPRMEFGSCGHVTTQKSDTKRPWLLCHDCQKGIQQQAQLDNGQGGGDYSFGGGKDDFLSEDHSKPYVYPGNSGAGGYGGNYGGQGYGGGNPGGCGGSSNYYWGHHSGQ